VKMNGRLIKVLVNEYHPAGHFTKRWDADVSSGLYLYRMVSPTGHHFGKTLLIK
jgi:hypothetical protein